MSDTLIWIGIALCIAHSATFSGLNLAVFSLSRLRLEAAARAGDRNAVGVLALRRDANFTLVTILWGNVAINVLLTLLAESLLAGVTAFLFATVAITFIGEIVPQAYFSRHALRVAARLAPLVHFYQILFWPVARPIGRLLDLWVGPEGIPWFREAELRDLLRYHACAAESEVCRLEAIGAMSFLALDDLPTGQEGEPLDPRSVLRLSFEDGRPVFPPFERSPDDPFLRRLDDSGKKWIVVVDGAEEPRVVLDAHVFLRNALFGEDPFRPDAACHRPLIVRNPDRPLGSVLHLLTVRPERSGDDVIDDDLILLWTPEERRIITGSDLLGRLLRGIARVSPISDEEPTPTPPPAAGSPTEPALITTRSHTSIRTLAMAAAHEGAPLGARPGRAGSAPSCSVDHENGCDSFHTHAEVPSWAAFA